MVSASLKAMLSTALGTLANADSFRNAGVELGDVEMANIFVDEIKSPTEFIFQSSTGSEVSVPIRDVQRSVPFREIVGHLRNVAIRNTRQRVDE